MTCMTKIGTPFQKKVLLYHKGNILVEIFGRKNDMLLQKKLSL